jgi:hypothetical protein
MTDAEFDSLIATAGETAATEEAPQADLGSKIDRLFDIRARMDILAQEKSDLQKENDCLELEIIDQMEKAGIDSSKTKSGAVTRKVELYPNIIDRKAFIDWCVENDNTSMMTVNANKATFKAYFNENGEYPEGLDAYSKSTLSVRKGR